MKPQKSYILFFIFLLIFSLTTPEYILPKKNRKDYVVLKKGETLWRIAKRYNCSVEYLCRINNIKDVTKIKTGAKIYLKRKNHKNRDHRLNLSLNLPVDGKVIKHFGIGNSAIQLNGVEIKGKRKALVRASESGVVKYAGILRGYGKIIVVQHSAHISMVYAYLDEIHVKVGEGVEKNKVIGRLGRDYLNRVNVLYFELLKDGQPIDPIKYFKL